MREIDDLIYKHISEDNKLYDMFYIELYKEIKNLTVCQYCMNNNSIVNKFYREEFQLSETVSYYNIGEPPKLICTKNIKEVISELDENMIINFILEYCI